MTKYLTINNKGFGIPITFYIIAGLAVTALIMGFWISKDHQKILRLESELGTTTATLKANKETAKIQRDADRKALEAKDAIIKDLLENQPTCPPTTIVCEDGECPITIEPCEAPW